VARTVREAGLPPMQSAATAERQDWAADLGARLDATTLQEEELSPFLDALRQRLS
jgi:hypothetical protein